MLRVRIVGRGELIEVCLCEELGLGENENSPTATLEFDESRFQRLSAASDIPRRETGLRHHMAGLARAHVVSVGCPAVG